MTYKRSGTRAGDWFFAMLVSVLVLGVSPMVVQASGTNIYFKTNDGNGTPAIGQEVAIGLYVDTDQPLNAYALQAVYDPATLELVRLDNSRSLIEIWQSPPHEDIQGSVVFGGASFHAFRGVRGELLTLVFRPRVTGKVQISSGATSVYLANGKGTRVLPGLTPLVLSVAATTTGSTSGSRSSMVASGAPVIDLVSLFTDPIRPDQKLVTYLVRDISSGVRSVEMRTMSWLTWTSWLPARNPTKAPHGAWLIELRVVNNDGQMVTERLYDRSNALLRVGELLLLIACFGLGLAWYRRRSRRGV